MRIEAQNPDEYSAQIPAERQAVFQQLRMVIQENLPAGFEETMSYGMVGYVVPHSIFPDGYHCDPALPLPFLSIASQKNFIGFYHMGLYAMPKVLDWFTKEYPKHSKYKLDMGKSCIRFKRMDNIPMDLIAELCQKITVADWVDAYTQGIRPKKK